MTRGRARARARTRVHFATDTLSQSKGTGNSGHREHFSRRRWGFAGLARVDSLLALALSHARKKSPELQVITTRHTQPELCWERGGTRRCLLAAIGVGMVILDCAQHCHVRLAWNLAGTGCTWKAASFISPGFLLPRMWKFVCRVVFQTRCIRICSHVRLPRL